MLQTRTGGGSKNVASWYKCKTRASCRSKAIKATEDEEDDDGDDGDDGEC